MKIRRYKNADFDAVARLFYDTVNTVNAADYTAAQLNAWVGNTESLKSRRLDLLKQFTLIAETDGVTVGFGSIDKNGELDLLFVHKDYQRRGIGTALCNELEKGFKAIKTYASVTAEPFFENRGYVVIKEQEVLCAGVKLKNFEMRKNIEKQP